jgi:hypothetical protein
MLDCIRTLEAPGVPIEFSFQTNAGNLTLSAEAYSLSPQLGALHVIRPQLKDQNGRLIAKLDSLEATNLRWLGGADQIIKIHGSGLEGQLVRMKDGRFDFQSFFTSGKSGKASVPFDVSVDRATVQFTDQTGKHPWSSTISAPHIVVAGLGQDWIASTTMRVSEVGEVSTKIQSVAGEGLKISGVTPSVQLATVAKHFAEGLRLAKFDSLDSASCGSLLAKGPFQVFVPIGKPARFVASVEAQSTNVAYKGFTAKSAIFSGRIATDGIAGVVNLLEGNTTAAFQGTAHWSEKGKAVGALTVNAPNVQSLPTWAKSFIPKRSNFENGAFRGWLTIQSATQYHLSGDVEAQSATYEGQRIDRPRIGLEVQPDRVVLDVRNALLSNQPVNGIVTVDPKTKAIVGSASAKSIDLAGAGALLGVNEVAGQASVSVLIDGTLTNPGVQFVTHGQGIATVLKNHTFSLGQFEVAGRYDRGSLSLSRGVFNTPEGLVVARGSLGAAGNLGVQLTGRGVLVAAYDPRLSGEANLSAKVTGTIKNPEVNGRVEGYDLTYKTRTVPAVVADFRVDRQGAEITNVQAARGTATLGGSARVQFRSGTLDGHLALRDVQLADWLSDEFVGAVDLPNATISGTLSHPLISGDVNGTSLVVRGVKVDKLAGSVKTDGNTVSVSDLKISGADGTLSGSGSYAIDQKVGSVSASAYGLTLDKLGSVIGIPITIHGTISGTANINVRGSDFIAGKVSGRLDGATVNGSKIGNGTWTVQSDGNLITGDLSIGDSDRYIKLNHLTYDPDHRKATGELQVQHLPAEEVISTALEYMPDLSLDSKESLQDLTGSMSLDCTFEGTPEDPALQLRKFEVANVEFRKQTVGDLSANVSLVAHKWTIQTLTLGKGPAEISLSGTVEEHGETHIDATTTNRFDLAKLSLFDTRLSRLTGTANLWFTVDGPTKSPRIVASLNLDNILAPPGMAAPEANDDRYLRIEFDKIVLNPSNASGPAAELTGDYFYKGFKGTITASSPFEYPFKIPTNKPIAATITLKKSDLSNIGQLLGGLDTARTSGSTEGSLTVSGTGDSLQVTGAINLNAEALSFMGMDDILKNAQASLKLSNNSLDFAATAEPIRGGTFHVGASVPFKSLSQLKDQFQQFGANSLLDSTLVGDAHFSNTQFRQRILGQSSLAGTIQSDIRVAGSVRKPNISGTIGLTDGDVILKSLTSSTLPKEERFIDPTFNVTLRLDNPTRLRSSTADMMMLGGGDLQGSMISPKVEAALSVEKGSIRLPASLLRIEQGGTVKVEYGTLGSSKPSAIVDMEGTTSVTAARYGDSDVQRYDITLGIKGDLLQDNGLTLSPSSDPPDLPPDRILAILGQADLIQSFSTNGKESSAIQTAMLSSVPMLLDPYTDQVAKGLGLDFLNLEYNSFDLASVAFGKILGSGFSIEGSRQLSEPPPGFPSRYDVRLVYRPRRFPGALRRVRFFFGSDQDRPWKVGLEYGVRF